METQVGESQVSQASDAQNQSARTERPFREVESVVIRFCGDSGDGMQLTGTEFTRATALAGNDLSTMPDFPAEIRAPAGTPAGVSGYQLQFSSREIGTPGDQPDVLVAMNPAALKANLADLLAGGSLIVNTGAFTKPNLTKAGYDANPLEDDTVAAYKVYKIDITRLTKLALASSGLDNKTADRCKNFFALGLAFWMFERPVESELDAIRAKFGKKPILAEANITVFKAGYHYGETAEVFAETGSVRVRKAPLPTGRYRNIMGNAATALGLVTAARLAKLDLVYAGYPITPASSILHELAGLRAHGVTTFQAEDEIAAACAAVGASFGGALGVTGSSGPGIALKGETIGLAVSLELPLVIVNVQRGGPSTGLPTKTEQADLMQALYGRNGECPVPVIAACTPADCFYAAIEAARVAIKYMTPVMLLTDGYLANGSEPWQLPRPGEIAPFPAVFRDDPEDYKVYRRDETTLARAWVRPGTPGLAHRIGGIEKDALTGNVSYDPDNHDWMCRIRAAKVERVQNEVPALKVNGPDEGELLLVGWGSTYGAINAAVAQARAEGRRVSSVHLRWLNPLDGKLGELMRRFTRVLVPEMNLGQLVQILRARFLVDAEPLTKVMGQPFKIAELCRAIEKRTTVRN
ncbi:MAG: 2-oxoacid:acceptor oxidoreductase subunit alpha [Myxococcales bacterium]|nr:2-oxoacid:acceptor oxidoreductase subunit alpha [Myxococcales bacterium]